MQMFRFSFGPTWSIVSPNPWPETRGFSRFSGRNEPKELVGLCNNPSYS